MGGSGCRESEVARVRTRSEQQVDAWVADASTSWEAFDGALRLLRDPRRPQGVRYPLRSVVLVALMAFICDCNDAEAVEDWAEDNEEWLCTFLELPHGVPSQDVFLAVFARLDPREFGNVFASWVGYLRARAAELGGAHIAIDGKTSRRTHGNEQPAIHTVSAWLSEAGLVLAQTRVDDKSNEIKAISELLGDLALRGTTVTIDAIGCQTAIAGAITAQGGHYLLAVKENHPTLRHEIETLFAETDGAASRARDLPALPEVNTHIETTKDHGRIETRRVEVIERLDRLPTARQRWSQLAFIARVTRTREVVATAKSSSETSYYIGSDAGAGVERTAHLIRSHWGIENGLHWVLDVAFNEDQSRHRTRNIAANFAVLRHMAVNLLKAETTCKLGIANKRKKAGRSNDYLLRVILGPGGDAG